MTDTAVSRNLDRRITDYIARVHTTVEQQPEPRAIVEAVSRAAHELLGGSLEIGPELRRVPATGYGRNLIHRDELGFVLLAMVWPAGVGGPPHDHGTWGVVSVVEGTVEVTGYEWDGETCVRELATIEASPGAVARVLPPHEDWHRVRNASAERPALTLHTYGKDIVRNRMFDEDLGGIRWVDQGLM